MKKNMIENLRKTLEKRCESVELFGILFKELSFSDKELESAVNYALELCWCYKDDFFETIAARLIQHEKEKLYWEGRKMPDAIKRIAKEANME